ncbi:head fiber protein [Raoultella terrigena]|uniref:head fiber protein n=1 Tax=Raoultella terrigena TaxID=577 RepID=UPI00117C2D88|nr:head fiber protein [Raoultella terrigena]
MTEKVVHQSGKTVVVASPGDAVSVPAATTTTAGVVKQSAAQANSTATDAAGVVTDFNALLAKLRAAGLLSN